MTHKIKQKVSADLHTHTTFSDGISTPELNVRVAACSDLEAIAIADHDSLLGLERGKKEARKWGITYIPAVEISTNIGHFLGYCFDEQKITDFVEYSRQRQEEEVKEKLKVLNDKGYQMSLRDVKYANNLEGKGRIGSVNIAMALMLKGYDKGKTLREIMRTIVKPLTKEVQSYSVLWQNAIDAIHDAKGIAILAHPPRDLKTVAEVKEVIEYGIDGLEVQPNQYYLAENRNQELQYSTVEELAKKHNILITAGSDYHGDFVQNRPMLTKYQYEIEKFW